MKFGDESLNFIFSFVYAIRQNEMCVSVNSEKYLSKNLPKIFEENPKGRALQFFRIYSYLIIVIV